VLAELPMKRAIEEEPVVEKKASLKMACKTINEEEEPRRRGRESLCSFVFSCHVVWRRREANGFCEIIKVLRLKNHKKGG